MSNPFFAIGSQSGETGDLLLGAASAKVSGDSSGNLLLVPATSQKVLVPSIAAPSGQTYIVQIDQYGNLSSAAGGGGVSFPLLGAADSVSAPDYSWASDTNTGIYRSGSHTIGFALNGTQYMNLSSSGHTMNADLNMQTHQISGITALTVANDSSSAQLQMTSSTGRPAALQLRSCRGTNASPTGTNIYDVLCNINFAGCTSDTHAFVNGARIYAGAVENFSSTAAGTSLFFQTCHRGSASLSFDWLMDANGMFGTYTDGQGDIGQNGSNRPGVINAMTAVTVSAAADAYATGSQTAHLVPDQLDIGLANTYGVFLNSDNPGVAAPDAEMEMGFKDSGMANGQISLYWGKHAGTNSMSVYSQDASYNETEYLRLDLSVASAPSIIGSAAEKGVLALSSTSHSHKGYVNISDGSYLVIGNQADSAEAWIAANFGGAAYGDLAQGLAVTGEGAYYGSIIGQVNCSDSKNPFLWFGRTRGSWASQTPVLSGDILGAMYFKVLAPVNNACVAITGLLDEPTDSTSGLGGKLVFSTIAQGSPNPAVDRMNIDSTGHINVINSAFNVGPHGVEYDNAIHARYSEPPINELGTFFVMTSIDGAGWGNLFTSECANDNGAPFAMSISQARGTYAAPTAVLAGDALGRIDWYSTDNTYITGNLSARIIVSCDEPVNSTPSASGGRMEFVTTTNGSTSHVTRLALDGAGHVIIPGIAAPSGQTYTVQIDQYGNLSSAAGGGGGSFLPLAGGTMSGAINMTSNAINLDSVNSIKAGTLSSQDRIQISASYQVGINLGLSAAPLNSATIHAVTAQSGVSNASTAGMYIDCYSSQSNPNSIKLRRAQGTSSAPSELSNGCGVGSLAFSVWNASSNFYDAGLIRCNATEAHSSSYGTSILFQTTVNTTTNLTSMFEMGAFDSGLGWAKNNSYVNLDMNGNSITGATVIKTHNSYHLEPLEVSYGPASGGFGVDLSASSSMVVTVSGPCSFVLNNPVAGGTYVMRLVQNGAGASAYSWPVNVKWSGGTAPTASAAGQIDLVSLYYDGATFYGTFSLNY